MLKYRLSAAATREATVERYQQAGTRDATSRARNIFLKHFFFVYFLSAMNFQSKANKYVCPNDRQLSLRAK